MKKEVNSHRAIRGYESFSQAYQDLFVRLMTNFKSGGTYLEIGASDPRDNSNTYLLERDLKWTGISIEIDEELSKLFNLERLNTCMCVDATLFGYEDFLISKFPSRKIDYLSLDIDPSAVARKNYTKTALTSLDNESSFDLGKTPVSDCVPRSKTEVKLAPPQTRHL